MALLGGGTGSAPGSPNPPHPKAEPGGRHSPLPQPFVPWLWALQCPWDVCTGRAVQSRCPQGWQRSGVTSPEPSSPSRPCQEGTAGIQLLWRCWGRAQPTFLGAATTWSWRSRGRSCPGRGEFGMWGSSVACPQPMGLCWHCCPPVPAQPPLQSLEPLENPQVPPGCAAEPEAQPSQVSLGACSTPETCPGSQPGAAETNPVRGPGTPGVSRAWGHCHTQRGIPVAAGCRAGVKGQLCLEAEPVSAPLLEVLINGTRLGQKPGKEQEARECWSVNSPGAGALSTPRRALQSSLITA